jgi:DNA polymerase/3'-5' exonuclease PolX
MTKEEIAGILERVATLLELKGENPFKIRAYTNAARTIETSGANSFRHNGHMPKGINLDVIGYECECTPGPW